MKRERIIVIRNPVLRRLRRNLRKILLKAISQKYDELTELRKFYIKAKGPDDEEGKKIRKQINKILSLPHSSICGCGNGGSCLSREKFVKENPMEELDPTDLDMAYYPRIRE